MTSTWPDHTLLTMDKQIAFIFSTTKEPMDRLFISSAILRLAILDNRVLAEFVTALGDFRSEDASPVRTDVSFTAGDLDLMRLLKITM